MSARAGPRTLTALVTDVAHSLMTVGPSTLVETCELVLQQLITYFDVDVSFVRRNDHDIGATVLLAEWPPRTEVPDPDPLGVVFFVDADPVFAALENLTQVMVARPSPTTAKYQERVQEGSGVPSVSSAMVPMLGHESTTGVLGLIKFGDRRWTTAEITALTALAALLAQALSAVTAEARLRYLAYHDELTALFNRRALLDHLADRMVPGAPGPVAVLFLDLDRVKAMNDFLGHAAGDQFLQGVSEHLQEAAGPADFLARFGGDELVVVLGQPGEAEAAMDQARRFQQVVTAPVSLGENEVSRTVSVGVAAGRPGEHTVAVLLAHASQAALAAKAAGGNTIVAFTEQMRVDNDERADVEIHLRDAIAGNQLRLYYQPQMDLVTGALVGAEALVRWQHPTRGLLPPSAFVEIAELTNLSGDLGRWVLSTACAQLELWQREYDLTGFSLGVNVSAAELITVDLATEVARTLRRHSVRASNLTMEITETAVVADLARARETLLALTALGVHLAIDDFGTGYSSFAQLKTLPVETLKIDRGFVTNLADNRDDQAIVRSITQLAASFGLETMAEGVETAAAVAALIELGCHQAQGYFYGRPSPAAELSVFLERERTRRAGQTA
jgi:diguanylate cyclase (GGDEF)-like protein